MIFVGILVLAGIGYLIIIFNSLVRLKNNIDKAAANIDVLLKQRFDEIPQLVKVCSQYMGYENELLQKLTGLRTEYDKAQENKGEDEEETVVYATELDTQLSETMGNLRATAEQYPDLKASEQFSHLSTRITNLESMIADRREYYNESVNVLNARVESFPDILIAKLFGYKQRALFKADEVERAIPSVSLHGYDQSLHSSKQ